MLYSINFYRVTNEGTEFESCEKIDAFPSLSRPIDPHSAEEFFKRYLKHDPKLLVFCDGIALEFKDGPIKMIHSFIFEESD